MAKTNETQNSRRVKYGLNVTVATILAIVLVFFVNWIAYRQYLRFDLTATRQYSLSDQTRKLLKNLEGEYRIVTLLPPAERVYDPRLQSIVQQAIDLTDEYGRYGKDLTIEHVDPSRELARFEQFCKGLLDRYKGSLTGAAQAIQAGRETLGELRGQSGEQLAPMRELLEDKSLPEGELKQFLQAVAQAFARFEQQFKAVESELDRSLDNALPDYDGALSTIKTLLGDLDEKVLGVAIDQFDTFANDPNISSTVHDRVLRIVDGLKRLRDNLNQGLKAVNLASSDEAYDKIRSSITNPETLVVIGPDQVRVLELREMFREPDQNQIRQLEPGQQPELSFLGEEILTGALASMQLDHKPMVVFVSRSQQPAIGVGGQYSQVAERMQNMDFEVEQWNPRGGMTQFGQPMPPGPAPEPDPDQKAIWIVTPGPPPDPRNPMASGGDEGVIEHISARLDAGDSALFMLGSNPAMRFNPTNPIRDLISEYGISVMLDRVIFREVTMPNQRRQASGQLEVDTWPGDLPIGQALPGMRGVFVQASPIEIGRAEDGGETGQNSKTWPLAEVKLQGLWAERNFEMYPNIKPADDTRADSFLIAAAAEKQGSRIVVVADPAWATDDIVTFGMMGRGTAHIFGAMFPANAELFVNSVYWLAELDQLIAASARTQDIRRVGAMTRSGLMAIQWTLLILLPLAALAGGIGVWLVRRKG